MRRDTARMLASCSQSMIRASIRAVKPELGSAHGTSICNTPWAEHCTRGTSASRIVLNWQVSRCRKERRRVS